MLKKLATIGIGMTVYEIFNWLFNYPLYMWVVGKLGLVDGGLVMTLLSFATCSLVFVVYEKMGIDWVGVNYMDELRNKKKRSRKERLILWVIRTEGKWGVVSFVVYSLFVDPLIVTVHYRQRQFSGINRRDWKLLLTSVLIANLYWTLRTGLLVMIADEVWRMI